MILDGHAWKKTRYESWPAQESIAKSMRSDRAQLGHMGVRAIYDCLKELVHAGVIRKNTRSVSRNRMRHPYVGANEYELLYRYPGFNPSSTELRVHFISSNRASAAGLGT